MSRVKVSKDGFARVRKALQDAGSRGLKVGVLGDQGSDLVMVATYNEFGTESIPERSFVRSTLAENRPKYQKAMQRGLEAIIDGRATVDTVLNLIGLEAVADIQKKITDIRTPPNAPVTIAQKGSDNPLIDTGRLRQSVTFSVVKVTPEDRKK